MVVIAIIAILAALLLAALGKAKRTAQSAQCTNNLRQVFVADLACEPSPGSCSLGKPRNYSYSPDFNAVEFSAAWSPDGARLGVVASINGAPGRVYFHPGTLASGGIAPTPSSFDRSDTIIGADHLDWSADGTFLTFTWKQPGSNEIYIVPADDPKRWQKLTNSAGNKDRPSRPLAASSSSPPPATRIPRSTSCPSAAGTRPT